MVAIRKLSIEGFRSIRAVRDLELRSLNVLIGANGSGKSNFLRAIDVLRTGIIDSDRIPDYGRRAGGADCLLHYGSKTTEQINIRAWFGGKVFNYLRDFELVLGRTDDDGLVPSTAARKPLYPPGIDVNVPVHDVRERRIDFLQDAMSGWRIFHFHDTGPTSPLKKTCKLHDNRRLREDGSNLAAFLYLLKHRYERDYNQIRKVVAMTAPFFEDFALRPLELNKETIRLEWRHQRSDDYFNASSISDGTLRFIALATLFLQPEALRPALILVDEPELGLHPHAITLMASLIKKASVFSQVIVATQSPTLLDHFEPEDVLVADRVDGATELRRLDEDRLKKWLEDYSLGQLWEKNELGGRPAVER